MTDTILADASIIDATGRVIERGFVSVRDGRIAEITDDLSNSRTRESEIVDVAGAYLLPGLINLHVHAQRRHLARQLTKELIRKGGPAVEAQPDEVRFLWAIRNCWAELREGATTIRDTGSGNAIANKVRWAFESALIRGPRFVSSGEGIAMTGGHGAHYEKQAALTADGVDGVRIAVRRQLALGADWIKLMASSGLSGMPTFEDPRLTEFTQEEMEAGVREAHKRRARVCSHAFFPDAVQNAVRAGVDCIEHGTALDMATVEMMASAGTFYVPTMSGMAEFCRREEAVGDPEVAKLIREVAVDPHSKSVAMAYEAGVRIGAGTDTLGDLVTEIEMLHAAGIPKMESILAATKVAAEILGMADEIGTIEVGKQADLLIIDANPLDTLGNLRTVREVYKGGHRVDSDWLVGTLEEAMSRPPLNPALPSYRRPSELYRGPE